MNSAPRIGVDLGGTKIEIAALDASGAVVATKRVDTPAGDYGATVDAIVALVPASRRSGRRAARSASPPPGRDRSRRDA